MKALEGKVALVTGGARGIGRGIAEALASAGADVALADLGERGGKWAYDLAGRSELEESAKAVRELGVRALPVTCDVTDAEQVSDAVAEVTRELGSLDVLVNNAGLVMSGAIAEFDEADWDRLMAVNLKGVFLMTRAAIPALTQSRGAVINIASIAGKRGYAGMGAYCASKFAVVGLTQALSGELGPAGVRVNAICPGLLGTAMWDYLGGEAMDQMVATRTPLGRAQTPEDIGQAAVYLATAPNVSGVALNVAGGLEVW
jgi:meso-butanediol dehydrogenase/(S,S)-butanediol dehydrogenase/diacetyl reductase